MSEPIVGLSDYDAERALIGAALITGEPAELPAADFALIKHRHIWQAFGTLQEESRAVNVITAADALRNAGTLMQVGDVAYLTQCILDCANSLDSASYALVVRECSVKRQARAALESGFRDVVKSNGNLPDVLGALGGKIQDLSISARSGKPLGVATSGQVINELREELERDVKAVIVPTGLRPIDSALGGGLERQTLSVLMARPAMGKTAALAQISDIVSAAKWIVLVVSREMSRRQWMRRIVFRRARLSILDHKQGNLSDNDAARLAAELNVLYERATLVFDEPDSAETSGGVMAVAESVARKFGRLDLVLIDHLRLFADKADNENHRLGDISWNFKQLARRMNCAVLCAAQLSRAVEGQGDKRPALKDLRDSGEIEENADNVIGLYRDKYYHADSDNIAEFAMRKFRDGELNSVAKMVWLDKYMALEPLEK